jgi:nucleoside-diphosphate-sugar epimerase
MTYENYFSNQRKIAFDLNADLPDQVQANIYDEANRVQEKILVPRKLEERNILIIGGAGYIGMPLSGHLLKRGYRVRCLDILLYQNQKCLDSLLKYPNYEFQYGDMVNAETMELALKDVTDVIILAGLVGDPITRRYPEESEAINDIGLKKMLRSLDGRGLNKVIFVSTCSNYGEIPLESVADEDFELKPLSSYADCKVAMELELLSGKERADYCGTILRFATAFGLSDRMRFDLTVSEFTRELFVGNLLEVYDSDTWRPYCHVSDFARVLERVLEMPRNAVAFEVFNAGGEINNFTKEMIVEEIRKSIPKSQIKYVDGGFDRRNYRVDFTKIQEKLYFTPKWTVGDGIVELVEVLKRNFLTDYEARINFYRNNEIAYTIQS